MKFFLLSTLALFLFSASHAQVAKKPFIEHFTQASCGPCAGQNPIMYTTLNTFGTANYVKLTYQTSWPGVDPMNAEYPNGVASRRAYYNVSGVPDVSLNGGATGSPNNVVTSATLASAAALTTPYNINVSHTWNTNTNSLDVSVDVINTTNAAISSADKLYLAMVEEQITFATAPGSNGETVFYNVLRQFYNTTTGAELNSATDNSNTLAAIPANDTASFTISIPTANLPSYLRDLEKVSFVAFVQNNATKVVEQAGKSQAGSVPNLLYASAAANSTVGTGYCNYNFTPSVNFTNTGATSITSVTAEYTINGGTAVSQTYNTAPIAQNQTVAITFPATALNIGTSTIQYNITDINNGGLYGGGTVAMDAETYSKLDSASVTTPITADFQLPVGTPSPTGAVADNPNLIRAFVVDNTVSNAVNWNLGGFGQSNGCFRWDFYGITAGGKSKLVFEKRNFTATHNNQLTFSHAHALYGGSEPDQLNVLVSTDCGVTWTTVWTRTGAALATAGPLTSGRFYPNVNQWRADTVNLSAYDGMADVIIAFEGNSGYGNCLYIDDINTTSSPGTSIATVANATSDLRIMPNPVANNMTLEFTMTDVADANISVVNTLGQTVQNVATGTYQGTNIIDVNTTDLAAGVYFLNIRTTEGANTTKRFVVRK